MAIHKLDFVEFEEMDYHLIAVHTTLEDYRLAYFINKVLLINLSKDKNEIHISIKEGETNFSRFYYHNNEKEITWNLVQNKNEVIQIKKENSQNLFSDIKLEVSTRVYLLPEFKKADYFLKIDNPDDRLNIDEIKTLINSIDAITTSYVVATNKIKSKYNLIF